LYIVVAAQTFSRRAFQIDGPATENAASPNPVLVLSTHYVHKKVIYLLIINHTHH